MAGEDEWSGGCGPGEVWEGVQMNGGEKEMHFLCFVAKSIRAIFTGLGTVLPVCNYAEHFQTSARSLKPYWNLSKTFRRPVADIST